jgi:hypothetical protein
MKKKFDVIEILRRNGISGSTLNTINIQDAFKPTYIQVDDSIISDETIIPWSLSGGSSNYQITGYTFIKTNTDININGLDVKINKNSIEVSGRTLSQNEYIVKDNLDIIKYIDQTENGTLLEFDQTFKYYNLIFTGSSNRELAYFNNEIFDFRTYGKIFNIKSKTQSSVSSIVLDTIQIQKDNLVYSIPSTNSNIRIFDYITKEITEIPCVSTSSLNYFYPYNSVKNYAVFFPTDSGKILKLNLDNGEFSLHGNFPLINNKFNNLNPKYLPSFDNKVYSLQLTYQNLVEFDVETNEINEYYISGNTGTERKFASQEKYGNLLYLIPENGLNFIVEFNTITKDIVYHNISSGNTNTSRFRESVIVGDYLYLIPLKYNSIIEMNLLTKEINYYTDPNLKYYGTCHTNNNNLYMLPWDSSLNSNILKFNIINKEITTFGSNMITLTYDKTLYKNKLYFFGRTDNKLYSFDFVNDILKEYNIKSLGSSVTSFVTIILDNKLYKFPSVTTGRVLLEVDLDKLE